MKGVFLLIGIYLFDFRLTNGDISNEDALGYLEDYGYVDRNKIISPERNPESSSIYSPPNAGHSSEENARLFREGIAQYQLFNHLNVTGELNEETINFMNRPRCGLEDIYKKYTLLGSKWEMTNLKYNILSYPTTLTKEDVQSEIFKAFKLWTRYTNLEFYPAFEGELEDFRIEFSSGMHNDRQPFDGPGGVLAHASGPPYGGSIHFDASEQWTKDSDSGINLYQVAVHEIGHALGLDHSGRRPSIMQPTYTRYTKSFDLFQDDIDAIQSLYGKRVPNDTVPSGKDSNSGSGSSTETSPQGTTEKTPDSTERNPTGTSEKTPEGTTESLPKMGSNEILCDYPKIDAIFAGSNGVTNVLQNSLFWAFKDNAVLTNYPVPITTQLRGPACCINAAFQNRKNITYVFEGFKFWKYNSDLIPFSNFPKEITKGFPGIPANLDTVFSLSNGTAFFFKGSLFWKYDSSRQPPVASDYPMPISQFWKNVPDYLDAAYALSDDTIYFFKDNMYYKWTSELAAVAPTYPKITTDKWFGCSAESDGNKGKEDPNTEDAVNALCANLDIDAIFTTSNGSKYIFSGSEYWLIEVSGNVPSGYPKLISEKWTRLPSNIDAAFADKADLIYFFKGDQYWVYQNSALKTDFPKKIESTFSGVSGNLDAALFYNDIYLLKDDKVWIVRDCDGNVCNNIVPMVYTMFFVSIPRNIDAAYEENDDLYFLKNTTYFKVPKPYFVFWSNNHLIEGPIKDLFNCKKSLVQNYLLGGDYEYDYYDNIKLRNDSVIGEERSFEIL